MPLPTIVPSPVRAFIEFFDAHLGALSFPDLDQDSLHAHAASVGDALDALEVARAQVEAARKQLEAEQAALLKHARKGLAYARIYAADRSELAAPLEQIELEPQSKPRRRRSRKPKIEAAPVEPLPLEEEGLRQAS
jgi:hypothetical protein